MPPLRTPEVKPPLGQQTARVTEGRARPPGIYLLERGRGGSEILRFMVEIVPGLSADGEPSEFEAHVEGGCLVDDVGRGHRLTWGDLALC